MLCNESWEIVPCATVVKSTLAIPHRVPQTAEGEVNSSESLHHQLRADVLSLLQIVYQLIVILTSTEGASYPRDHA